MATLRNDEFLASSLSVTLTLSPFDDEGWSAFELTLFDDAACEHAVVTGTGALSADDFARLAAALERVSGGTPVSVEFAPVDPIFLMRARTFGRGSIELIWMVDKGFVATGVSTDTGIALILTVQPEAVSAFADVLAREVSRAVAP